MNPTKDARTILATDMYADSVMGEIKKKNLPKNILMGGTFDDEIRVFAGTSLPEIERISIIKTLRKVKGNKQKASKLLDISRRSLYNKLEDYNIEESEYTD